MKEGAPRGSRLPTAQIQEARIVILTASWHRAITSRLRDAATQHLSHAGIKSLQEQEVPGCFELPLAAELFAAQRQIDGFLALGCILRGETSHFDHICSACCDGLLQVSLRHQKPIGMGVIMAHHIEQAEARSQNDNNKGIEAADALIQMLLLKKVS